jgi:spermidine/putrescine transport system substrate-binding protein
MRVAPINRLFGISTALLVTLCVLFASGCGGGSGSGGSTSSEGNGSSVSGAGQTLNILTWETYHEPEWLKEVEEKLDIHVNATNVGSITEALAKVRANPSEYDIVLATAGSLNKYVESNLLEPIDVSRVPNLKNNKLALPWEEGVTVDGKLYGLMYTWGTIPLAYVPESVEGLNLKQYENEKGELTNWNVLWDPALKGKVTILEDALSVLPTVGLALGFEDPWNMNEQQLEEFEKKLFELRPQVRVLATGDNAQEAAFASGEAYAGLVGGPYVAGPLKEEGKNLVIKNEAEPGTAVWVDNYSITKEGGASSPAKLAAVYEFINFTLTVPWQARMVAETGQSGMINLQQATSKAAKAQHLTQAEIAETLIPETEKGPAFYDNLHLLQEYKDLERMLEIWNEFTSGVGGI